MGNIPWAKPTVADEELKQVMHSFETDWLTMGPKVKEFEQLMAERVEAPHAIAVTNGTIALDLAFKTLGIGPGDEVIVPAMTYIATVSAICYQHAIPVFVDIEEQTNNLDPNEIESAITDKTKAIVFIDYGGNPADYASIKSIAEKHNLTLLKDGAQSLGAIYQGRPAEAVTEISTISFHMAKIMTCVEGGMIFTHNEEYAKELRIRRNQGESGKYLHSHLGTNARMTDLNAAIGLEQVKKLDYLLAERLRVSELYDQQFKSHESVKTVSCPWENSRDSRFFYPILIPNRDRVAKGMKEQGIDTRVAYPLPVYKQEVFTSGRCACRYGKTPVTNKFTAEVLNLPLFPGMTDEEVERVAQAVFSLI